MKILILRYLILLQISVVFHGSTCGQYVHSQFNLEGRTNVDTGTATLLPLGRDLYYPNQKGTYAVAIANGRFSFSDSILYPYAFRLGIKQKGVIIYISDYFIVDSGIQEATFDTDSLREIPFIGNKSMEEMRAEYIPYFSGIIGLKGNIEQEYDSLKNIYKETIPSNLVVKLSNKSDSIQHEENRRLLLYSTQHADSYLALWILIKQLKKGYEPILDSVYMVFVDSIKNSYTGRKIFENINLYKTLREGNYFPKLFVLDKNYKSELIPRIAENTNYTLIDFWYSHCSPCINEFDALESIFKTYKNEGFNIVGVSIDGKNAIADWKAAILKYHLSWDQYLDLDGREAHNLSVLQCPTNYLLDKHGRIIAKNIRPSQLLNFMKTLKK